MLFPGEKSEIRIEWLSWHALADAVAKNTPSGFQEDSRVFIAPSRLGTSCIGLCPAIHEMEIPDEVKMWMLRKINHSGGLKWPSTEEGHRERRQFCLDRANEMETQAIFHEIAEKGSTAPAREICAPAQSLPTGLSGVFTYAVMLAEAGNEIDSTKAAELLGMSEEIYRSCRAELVKATAALLQSIAAPLPVRLGAMNIKP